MSQNNLYDDFQNKLSKTEVAHLSTKYMKNVDSKFKNLPICNYDIVESENELKYENILNCDLIDYLNNLDDNILYSCLLCSTESSTVNPVSLCESCLTNYYNILDEYDIDYKRDPEFEYFNDDDNRDLIKLHKICYKNAYANKSNIKIITTNIVNLLNVKYLCLQRRDVIKFLRNLFDYFCIEDIYIIHLDIILERIDLNLINYDFVNNDNNWKIFLSFVLWMILETDIDEWYNDKTLINFLIKKHNIIETFSNSFIENYKIDIFFASGCRFIVFPEQVYNRIIV